MKNESRMRRTPQQARGQRRVSRILDAAAQVFAETGYEAATTNAIAIRANTSIGSLYQFFPDKGAILDALALRYRGLLSQLLDEVLSTNGSSPLETFSTLTERMTDFCRVNPAFQAMFIAACDSRALTAAADQVTQIITQRVGAHLLATVPTLTPEESEFSATVVVHLMRALIPPASAGMSDHNPALVEQLKRLIGLYIEASMPSTNLPPAPKA